tara:strand:- start:931 stop:2190 length:1260 start_codon:yes stop_codon:yes gene_type:complete
MQVIYKFGGASIKDADSIKNVLEIVQERKIDKLYIIFSAIGKVTNMLEELVDLYASFQDTSIQLSKIKKFHYNIIDQLFSRDDKVFEVINNLFIEIEWILEEEYNSEYDYNYDQIVSVGELLSTNIMSAYLQKNDCTNTLIDARDIIKTNDNFRSADIDWDLTESSIRTIKESDIMITQGFIGCTKQNSTTTLGREGSDFTAAILAYFLDVCELVIWKDVPGILNADPRFFNKTQKFKILPFEEAIELAFYGAKVIHPRTIQPLKKKSIPLTVKSFIDLKSSGTVIKKTNKIEPAVPSYIVKEDQVLISISDKSLDFIIEKHLSSIFSLFYDNGIRVNMMQNSAVSFSVCVDNDKHKIPNLLDILNKKFDVYYNQDLTLITIRHYTDLIVSDFLKGRDIILEQRTRSTLQLIMKSGNLF